MKPGKLYVMEAHLGYYSGFAGETKLLFQFKEMDSITRNGGSVEVKVGEKKYKFSQFENAKLAFQYIRTSWLGCCPEKDTGDSPDEKDDGSSSNKPIPTEAKGPSSGEASTKNRDQAQSRSKELKPSTPPTAEPNPVPKPSMNPAPSQMVEEAKVPSGGSYVGPLPPIDDPQLIEKSYAKYPKGKTEFARYVFMFGVDEYYNRFVSPNAPFHDIKLFEILGKREMRTVG